jgi:ATP-binding cassette subfamily B protein
MSVQAVKPRAISKQQEDRKPELRVSTFKRILLIFRPYRGQMILVVLSILVSTALSLVVPLLIPALVDDGLDHRRIGHLILYGLLMSSAAILSGVISVGQTYLSNRVGQYVMRDLRNTLYAHLQSLSLRFFTSSQTGEIQSRLSNDIASAQSAVTDTFTILVTNLIMVVGTTIAMLCLSPVLTLVTFIFLPFFLIFALKVGNSRRESLKATQQSLASLTALMQETLSVSGILLIKTFGRKRFAQSQFEEKNHKLAELSIRQQVLGRWFLMFVNTFVTLVPIILYVVAGFLMTYLPGSIHVTIGILIAFITLQERLFGPFNTLILALINAYGSLALFDRIFEYLDQKVEIQDAPDVIHLSSADVHGEVAFKDVSFTYNRHNADPLSWRRDHLDGDIAASKEKNLACKEPESYATLRNLSFEIKPGQLVALVGPSGAGKTTITYLLSRLYDVDSGAIEIDGYDLRKIALSSLENLIGSVTQETYLFHSSIRDNLLYIRPEATEEDVIAATKAAAIHERIMELDNGYETIVGERGYKLSGGEKQRIAIARVLLKNPKILILDEATSSLDTTSERLIQQALGPLMKGRTTIAVAHRLSTVLAADLILVLNKGEIVERGTHKELLTCGGMYARLYYQQFADQA